MTAEEAVSLLDGMKSLGAGAMVALGLWLPAYVRRRIKRPEREAEQEAEPRRDRRVADRPSDAVTLRRIESDDDANDRLFEILRERLEAIERRCDQCERRENEARLREARLLARITAAETYIDKLCEVLHKHHITVPPRTLITVDDLGNSGG